ncbi:uncharacterized protein kcnk4a isoform X2 [Gouania willdenowi]|uniref:uncharacterized protein kcnk4a isoform X2 n=1 Tax=Gouania willdenowi TaxID=441366 RepID=UPI001054BA38|nr:uncharacterized protein LOC114471312 isoform X2 [Gouania willdenowi]
MRCTTLITLLLGVMLYLVMGALVFLNLEMPEETLAYKALLKTVENFLFNNSCVTELDFHKLVQAVVSAVEAGLDVSSLPENHTSRWDLASAIFFCGTIITTIGFGNLSPQTWYGQLFCVCYALVGIPMFGILLAGVGDHMGTVLRRAVAKIETLFLKHKVRPTTVEDWSFLESLYFVVITLTTVGFGDFVPVGGTEDGKIFKPLVLLWIVFGLAYFASILTMIGNWLRVLSKKTRAEMEELRAHATDWTQNMDFRIPNPLEFNDPFLLQRRRWKRSERRRIRRGAQGTLGNWVRGGSENGHLPNHWANHSNSMSKLEARSSLERAVCAKARQQASAPGKGAASGMSHGLRPEPMRVGQDRMVHHLLTRSFSLPVAHSISELDSAVPMHEGSLTGSASPCESRSGGSSSCSSCSTLSRSEPNRSISCTEERAALMNTTQEQDRLTQADSGESATQYTHTLLPELGLLSQPSQHASALLSILPTPPPLSTTPSSSCKLLDFFGENLAFIDESSDTLSDRGREHEVKRRRPRKPKRRSMRRQLSHRCTPLQVRRLSRDTQPPSNPPTPPPDSAWSHAPASELQMDSTL